MAEALLSPQRNADVAPSSSFNQTWSPSAANAFDISTLPVAKAHKAWERRPQAPRSTVAKYKKVWRTYGLRSTNGDDDADDETESHRARAVKRMCVNDGAAPVPRIISSKGRKNYAGTKFDRRKSGITRKWNCRYQNRAVLPADRFIGKMRQLSDMTSIDDTNDDPPTEDFGLATATDFTEANQLVDTTAASPKRVPPANRKRRSLGRHSLGAKRGIRFSFGGSMVPSIAEEPAQENVAALCLSPRKKTHKTVSFMTDQAETPVQHEKVASESQEEAPKENNATHPDVNGSPPLSPVSAAEVIASSTSRPLDEPEPQTDEMSAVAEDADTIEYDVEVTAKPSDPSAVVSIEDEASSQSPLPSEERSEEADVPLDAEDTKPDIAEDDTASHWADETTTHLELDTALLKDFLSRTAAAKATRLESGRRLSLPRRASLLNRRDSDAIRMALASPRKPLDDKDPNSPAASPAKLLDLPGVKGLAAQLDAITGGPLGSRLAEINFDDDDDTTISGIGSRRSARQRSRLPSLLNEPKVPSKISVKRTDGSDPVVVKKTEAQELSVLTRSNTRRNKGTSLTRLARLKKLKFEGMAEAWTEGKVKEMAAMNTRDDVTGGTSQALEEQGQELAWKIPAPGEKGVRWREKDDLLTFFGGAVAVEVPSDTSLDDVATKIPPPSSLNALSASTLSAQLDIDSPRKKNNPARVRRLRGLGTTNGTPGKALLASASLLPDEVAEEKEKSKVAAPKERRSRIAAPTPKKLKLTVKGDESAPSLLKAPEVSVPKSLSMSAASSSGSDAKEVAEARERRLASPRKIPQFASSHAAPSGGTRRRRM